MRRIALETTIKTTLQAPPRYRGPPQAEKIVGARRSGRAGAKDEGRQGRQERKKKRKGYLEKSQWPVLHSRP